MAHNEDLDVKAPLFRLGGAGDINIGASSLDYSAKAAVVATSKGQGGAERDNLAGLTVPVHLSGPFDDLKYQVDYRGHGGQRPQVGNRAEAKGAPGSRAQGRQNQR